MHDTPYALSPTTTEWLQHVADQAAEVAFWMRRGTGVDPKLELHKAIELPLPGQDWLSNARRHEKVQKMIDKMAADLIVTKHPEVWDTLHGMPFGMLSQVGCFDDVRVTARLFWDAEREIPCHVLVLTWAGGPRSKL